jgi:hypothetical protein
LNNVHFTACRTSQAFLACSLHARTAVFLLFGRCDHAREGAISRQHARFFAGLPQSKRTSALVECRNAAAMRRLGGPSASRHVDDRPATTGSEKRATPRYFVS